jgi:hypothetical protein
MPITDIPMEDSPTMIKRIALAVGSVAAVGVLALGLAAAGFGPAAQVDAGQALTDQDVAAMALPAADPAAEPVTQVQTETVYVKPAATPKVIHVTKKVGAAQKQQTVVVRTKRASHGGDDDRYEHEHEADD